MLDLRRLRILHRMAQHGTVAATAESLHLTGPAVSQHLAALEREAGAQLLEKRGRTLALTPAGRLLVSHAEIILDDLGAAESALAALTLHGTGTVRVAAFPSAARNLVPAAWAALRDDPAGPVALRLVEHEPDDAVTALLRRGVDVAVVHSYSLLPRTVPTGLDERRLLDDPVVLAVPPSMASARGLLPDQSVELGDFSAARWLVPRPAESCHEMIQRACGAAGFVPETVAEATDFSVLTALVAAGAGVALVPRMALPDGGAPVSLHPLNRPVTRKVFALTRPGAGRRPDIGRALDTLAEVAAARGATARTP
jgi:DNA-binding transcriptional LysR family regulator